MTKKNSSTLGGDALALTISNFAVSLLGMISSMLLARFRTLNEYGTYSQVIMVVDLVSTILLLGLPGCVNYFLAKTDSESERQKFLSIYLLISTIMTVIIAVCLFLATPLIVAYFKNPYISAFAYVFALYPWASIMINSLSNVCVVYGLAKRLVLFNFLHAVATLLLLLLARVFNLTFQTYTVLYIGSMLLFAIFAVAWIKHIAGGLRVTWDLKLVKAIFTFSIPLGLASSVGTLNGELDKLIIGKFFSTEEYAIFANAAKQLPVTMLATSLSTVLMPRMVRLLKDERREEAVGLWGSSIEISLCVLCLIAGGFVVFAPDVMSLFYSEKYVTPDGVAVFRLYSLMLILRATYWGLVLNTTGKTKLVLLSSILSLILNSMGNVICYYAFGFIGPAISTLAVTAVMGGLQLLWTSKILHIPMRRIWPWNKMIMMLVATAIVGAVFYCVKYFLLPDFSRAISIVTSIVLGIIWASVHFLIHRKSLASAWAKLSKKEERIL